MSSIEALVIRIDVTINKDGSLTVSDHGRDASWYAHYGNSTVEVIFTIILVVVLVKVVIKNWEGSTGLVLRSLMPYLSWLEVKLLVISAVWRWKWPEAVTTQKKNRYCLSPSLEPKWPLILGDWLLLTDLFLSYCREQPRNLLFLLRMFACLWPVELAKWGFHYVELCQPQWRNKGNIDSSSLLKERKVVSKFSHSPSIMTVIQISYPLVIMSRTKDGGTGEPRTILPRPWTTCWQVWKRIRIWKVPDYRSLSVSYQS